MNFKTDTYHYIFIKKKKVPSINTKERKREKKKSLKFTLILVKYVNIFLIISMYLWVLFFSDMLTSKTDLLNQN